MVIPFIETNSSQWHKTNIKILSPYSGVASCGAIDLNQASIHTWIIQSYWSVLHKADMLWGTKFVLGLHLTFNTKEIKKTKQTTTKTKQKHNTIQQQQKIPKMWLFTTNHNHSNGSNTICLSISAFWLQAPSQLFVCMYVFIYFYCPVAVTWMLSEASKQNSHITNTSLFCIVL